MKYINHLAFLVLFFIEVGCAPFTDITIYSAKKTYSNEADKVIKKSLKTKHLGISQYKDSIFPNDLICNNKSIEHLVIDNRNFYFCNKHPEHCQKHLNKVVMVNSMLLNISCLNSLKSIKHLQLSGFEFDTIPLALSNLESLEELWLTYFDTKNIPNDLRAFKNLKKIYWELYTVDEAYDSLLLPVSVKEVDIKAIDMTFTNRIKLVKAILRNRQVEKIGFYASNIEETCIIQDVIKNHALNDKILSLSLSNKIACNRLKKAQNNYTYE